MPDKEYKDYSAGVGNPADDSIVLLQPDPTDPVEANRVYEKWTFSQLKEAIKDYVLTFVTALNIFLSVDWEADPLGGAVEPEDSVEEAISKLQGQNNNLTLLKKNNIETSGNAVISSNNLDWKSGGQNYDIIIIDATSPVAINTISNIEQGIKKVIVNGTGTLTFATGLIPTKRIKGDRYTADSINLGRLDCYDDSIPIVTFEWVNNLIDGNQNNG